MEAQKNEILLESGTNEMEFIEFYLINGNQKKEYYGINVAKVLEIMRFPKVYTHIPGSRGSTILGMFNYRNKVVSIIDIKKTLTGEEVSKDNSKIIVAEFNNTINAFAISGVNRIRRISWEDIEPPDDHIAEYSEDSVIGTVQMDNNLIFLINVEKIIGELNPHIAMQGVAEAEKITDKKYKAMVVDDSAFTRQMLSTILYNAGFKTFEFKNGKEAWEFIQKNQNGNGDHKNIADVLVTDIEMPQMDGLHLTKKIKENPNLKNFPTILFSSIISDRVKHKGDSVGADDQVSKPEASSLARKAIALIEKQ